MENYIVINGKKVELTEEQLKALGIKTEKKRNNPFNDNLKVNDRFFYIRDDSVVDEYYYIREDDCINKVNCFNDKNFAKQVCLHELLNRKLLKYAWDNEAEDCEWDKGSKNLHYYIYLDNTTHGYFQIEANNYNRSQNTYFSKAEVARQAIEDVIKPFMEEHPEFVW